MSSIRENIREELKRNPLTVAATVAGVLVALGSLFIAWLQYANSLIVQNTQTTIQIPQSSQFSLANLALVISFFCAASLSSATLVRFLARVHDFVALVISIPIAAITGFTTLVVLNLAPPRGLSPEAIKSAVELVFYGICVVFVAINGMAVCRDIGSMFQQEKSNSVDKIAESLPVGGLLFVVGLLLFIWSSFVWWGMAKLSELFLQPLP